MLNYKHLYYFREVATLGSITRASEHQSIAYKLLEPAMKLPKPIHIVCTEGKLSDLLGELAAHRMELVIADSPMSSTLHVKGFNHELGTSGISFFAHQSVQANLQGAFPQCLDDAPLLGAAR